MLLLPHGCSCSNISVHPKNWKTISATIKKDWYIHYRFYDPGILNADGAPSCRQVFIKGMNAYKTQKERYDATKAILDNELYMLRYEGYNPITGVMRGQSSTDGSIDQLTPFLIALTEADKKLEVSQSTHLVIKSILGYVKKAAVQMGLISLPICQIKRKDMRRLLDRCGEIKGSKWTANNFNTYRAHLMMLFRKIVEYEAIDQNPMREIPKQKKIKKIRLTLSREERIKIDEHLKVSAYPFWRFMQIFFHSGARMSELMMLKGKDIDLGRQRFKSVVKKGREFREVERTIKDIALPLWKELADICGPDEYVFSRDLLPGISHIRPDQVTKRWYYLVKKPLGIKADFYSLKHLNTSETVDALDERAAADQNAHTTTAMVVNIYDTVRPQRQHDRLKGVKNSFA